MKKTFITLLALAGVAMGETYTPLTEDSWTHSAQRSARPAWAQNTTDGTLVLTNSNWSQAYSTYDFAENLEGPLSFALTVNRTSGNCYFSIAQVGSAGAVVIGTNEYGDGSMYAGTTTTIGSTAYTLNRSWEGDTVEDVTITSTNVKGDHFADSVFNTDATSTISGTTYVNAEGKTVLTLKAEGDKMSASVTKDIVLWEGFTLDKIVISGDGPNDHKGIWTVSNLSVTGTPSVPEPATATLGLLALAGLCVRRRRA